MPPHRAVLVEVKLASPWLDNADPVHLDGIVMQAHARRWGMERDVSRVESLAGLRDQADMRLPVSVIVVDGVSCAVCSAAEVVTPVAPAVVHQVKRRDHTDWDRLDRPVSVAAGPHKDRLERNYGQVASGLRWHAWGNRGELLDLLRLLWGPRGRPHGFIGSKRRSGSGEIAAWDVFDGIHEPDRCWLHEGRAVRHLPAEVVLHAERWRMGASRSPYWHPERRGSVPWIGTSVELLPEAHAALTGLACP